MKSKYASPSSQNYNVYDFCLYFREEILSIVALLSSESVFVTSPSKREKAVAAHKKFFSSSGDHITLLNIYRSFSAVTQKKVLTGFK